MCLEAVTHTPKLLNSAGFFVFKITFVLISQAQEDCKDKWIHFELNKDPLLITLRNFQSLLWAVTNK